MIRTLAVGLSSVLIALGTAGSAAVASTDRTSDRRTVIDTIVEPPGEPCGVSDHPPLRPGDSGPAVRHLQCLLRLHEIDVPLDGYFGRETRDGLVEFQVRCGLVVDGILGPRLWRALHTGC